MIHRSKFFDNFGQVLAKYPDVDFGDLFSKGQMDSKRWLVDTLLSLNPDMGTVFLCAGWYGSLATFLLETNLRIDKIRSFDIDPSCAKIADTFNRSWVMDGWKFKATTLDINEIKYPTTYITSRADGSTVELFDNPRTIINTSCEHILNFSAWYNKIPDGKIVVIQSNNFHEVEEHVNTHDTLEEFSASAPMKTVLYEGELPLEKYTRFMKIGIK